jgi:hypothetical protein
VRQNERTEVSRTTGEGEVEKKGTSECSMLYLEVNGQSHDDNDVGQD